MRALRRSAFRQYGTGGTTELLGLNAGTLASRLKRLGISVAVKAITKKPDAAMNAVSRAVKLTRADI